jgi:SNF2 family DNA or RNA helicase
MRNYPRRINQSEMVYYGYSFKSINEISQNVHFGWLLKKPYVIDDDSYEDSFVEKYSYALIDTDKIISYVPKNFKSEFFEKILHKKNTGWYKKIISNKSTMATKYLCQIQLCVNEDVLYNRIINDEIYICEKEFLYYYLCEKTDMSENLKDDWKNNWITENNLSSQPNNFNVKLFEYQLRSLKWMSDIENNNTDNKFYPYLSMESITNHPLISKLDFDIFDRSFVLENHMVHKLISSGGILADEIGLGKTLTSIALICKNPCVIKPNIELGSLSINLTKNNKLCTGTTLIICPSHLTKQWESEIIKTCPKLKLAVIMTKTNHKKYTYLDLLNIDVMVVSLDFFTNLKWYVNIESNLEKPKKYSYNGDSRLTSTRMVKGFEGRLRTVYQNFRYKVSPVEFVPNVHTYLLKNIFRFENINWYRIMVDEGHEIFKINYDDDLYDMKKLYQLKFINALSSKYRWCISGTPFYDKIGLKQTLQFLNFKSTKQIKVKQKNIIVNLNFDEIANEGVILQNLTSSIYKQIYIRNTMNSVKDILNIPPAIIETIFLDFSGFEQVLYNSIKRVSSSLYLRKLCCNIQINDKFTSIDNFSVYNFDEVKKKIIHETEATINNIKCKLLKLDKNSNEYKDKSKLLTTQMNSHEFILKTFEKQTIKDIEKDLCPICKCNFEDPIVTNCGHNFCYDCINSLLNIDSYKNECPICRNKIYRSTIYKLNKDPNKEKLDNLIYKYGTKIAKLIKLTKHILTDKKNRIIIFSQWDKLLTMIGSVLKSNGVDNIFCKGNIHQQNSSIMSFRSKSKRIIMLSTENAASGTNLTEATHIIFMEPIKGDKDDIQSMENQAIGRAIRIGQKNQVKVIKLIIKDTIEEIIYNNYCLT